MSTTATPAKPSNLFRSIALRGAPEQIDRENGVLRGVKVIELGPLKDGDPRPYYVDVTTLEQVVELGNRPNKGIKSRFTHPNMSEDGLGKQLGKQKNFSIQGNAAIADFHLGSSARKEHSDHVFDMAAEAPEDIGLSIVAVFDEEAMESEANEDGLQPIRLTGLRAVDFVGEGAATDGLFDLDDRSGIPAAVTQFLDTYFADSDPEDVADRALGLLRRYYSRDFSRGDYEMTTQAQAPAAPVAETDDFNRELGQRYIAAFGEIGAAWFVEGKTFEDCFALKMADFETALAAKDEQIEQLQVQIEAALAAAGEADPLDSTEGVQLSDEDNALAARIKVLVEEGHSPNRAKFMANAEASKVSHN